ncbi:MAG: hypothetical protein ACK506_12855 [Pirellula sp.]
MSYNANRYIAPWWWIVIWMTWGALMALITYAVDGVPVTSLLWFLSGCSYAILLFPVTRPLVLPVMDWYARNEELPEEQKTRFRELVLRGRDPNDAELSMLSKACWNRMPLIAPLFAAGSLGIIIGSLTGVALACLPSSESSATAGGIGGVLLGIPAVAILAAIIFAAMIPKQDYAAHRVHPRLLMLLSPFFIVPIAIHCVIWFLYGDKPRTR